MTYFLKLENGLKFGPILRSYSVKARSPTFLENNFQVKPIEKRWRTQIKLDLNYKII
jgi:hypothetical protein